MTAKDLCEKMFRDIKKLEESKKKPGKKEQRKKANKWINLT